MMLQTRQLQFSYDDHRSFSFPDIDCGAGHSILVLGPSGCGKSTWLHLICGLLRPRSGSIQINQTDITNLSPQAMDAFRGKHIGVALQKPYFIQSLNVLENLRLFQNMNDRSVSSDYAVELLEALGLKGKEGQSTRTLSQGELQRLNFARALVCKPELLLADEPTSALDDQHAERIAGMLQDLAAKQGAALIVVTHDQRLKHRFPDQIQLT
ncbi:MAG TPA: ATP-binding cassette domain-containing protein [Saprospiraceae bacterium]|nr:ATP-binding cassette domain-containing protein [Saprospiraceae bacterium]